MWTIGWLLMFMLRKKETVLFFYASSTKEITSKMRKKEKTYRSKNALSTTFLKATQNHTSFLSQQSNHLSKDLLEQLFTKYQCFTISPKCNSCNACSMNFKSVPCCWPHHLHLLDYQPLSNHLNWLNKTYQICSHFWSCPHITSGFSLPVQIILQPARLP